MNMGARGRRAVAVVRRLLDKVRRRNTSHPDPVSAGTPSRMTSWRVLFLALLGTSVFFYGLLRDFPDQDMARYFLRELSENNGIGLLAKDARFLPPASLSYAGIALVTPTPAGPLSWSIDRASAHLELASLIGRKPRVNFQVDAYGGRFQGRLRHLSKTRNHLNGKTVRPVDLGKTRPLFHQDIAGSMNLKTDFTWQTGSEALGHGIVSTDIVHLVLRSLSINGFPLPPVTFDTVHSQVFLSGGRGRVERLQATGPLADIDGSGTFLISTPYPNTVLHLKLLVHLKGPLNILPLPGMTGDGGADKVMTLTLDGPVSNLNIAMNGIPLPH